MPIIHKLNPIPHHMTLISHSAVRHRRTPSAEHYYGNASLHASPPSPHPFIPLTPPLTPLKPLEALATALATTQKGIFERPHDVLIA